MLQRNALGAGGVFRCIDVEKRINRLIRPIGDRNTMPSGDQVGSVSGSRRRSSSRTWLAILVAAVLIAAGFGINKLVNLRAKSDHSNLPPIKVVPLTSAPSIERNPALSPDGKQIAYVFTGDKGDNNFDIYVKLIGLPSLLADLCSRAGHEPGVVTRMAAPSLSCVRCRKTGPH